MNHVYHYTNAEVNLSLLISSSHDQTDYQPKCCSK